MKKATGLVALYIVMLLAGATQAVEINKDGKGADGSPAPETARAFLSFYGRLKLGFDSDFVYVGSDGMPDHKMMVGITAWQQQVPLPQNYFGENAWRIPLKPVEAANPLSAKDHFFRGAIALAVNGVPIFNPIKNDGRTDTLIAGELDEWGGHCGRGDDYHYHIAPLHLEKLIGAGKPIAYALDGYPIYGYNESDGSPAKNLDAFNGHKDAAGHYHYHATKNYPYLNGGFHGEVTDKGGQVDPQPNAAPVRPAGEPLRGATITDFSSMDAKKFSLTYKVNGKPRTIDYSIEDDGTYHFKFTEADGIIRNEVYKRSDRGPGGGGPGGPGGRGPRDAERSERRGPPQNGGGGHDSSKDEMPKSESISKPVPGFILKSSAFADGGAYPKEFTGDGDGITPPLEWGGAPAGTKSFAIIMHHIPGPGGVKWYWTLYNLPANQEHLPKNAKGIGTLGNNCINRILGYAPPHSKGPGAKTYIMTIYALSEAPKITVPANEVNRDVLLAAMKDHVLGTAELKTIYTRGETGSAQQGPGGRAQNSDQAPPRPGDNLPPRPPQDGPPEPPKRN